MSTFLFILSLPHNRDILVMAGAVPSDPSQLGGTHSPVINHKAHLQGHSAELETTDCYTPLSHLQTNSPQFCLFFFYFIDT